MQKQVNVAIYQGEGRLVKDNILLGEIHMPVPPRRAGEIGIDVRFTYDVNGIVEVETTVAATGEHKRVVIEENPGVLTADEIEERLRELAAYKIHPRDQAENRAVLARADRLYEQLLGQARDFLGQQIGVFTSILERQDPQQIKQARDDLGAAARTRSKATPTSKDCAARRLNLARVRVPISCALARARHCTHAR